MNSPKTSVHTAQSPTTSALPRWLSHPGSSAGSTPRSAPGEDARSESRRAARWAGSVSPTGPAAAIVCSRIRHCRRPSRLASSIRSSIARWYPASSGAVARMAHTLAASHSSASSASAASARSALPASTASYTSRRPGRRRTWRVPPRPGDRLAGVLLLRPCRLRLFPPIRRGCHGGNSVVPPGRRGGLERRAPMRDRMVRGEGCLPDAGVDRVRQELGRALWVVDYVDEEDAPTYVAGADRALGLLGKLIDDGATDETATLAEHAIDLLADAVEKVQDEGEAQQSLRWAVQIHMRAVTAVRPDSTALAERLFTWAVADEWSVFADAVSDYAEPLGSVGGARLRELIDEELDRLPRLGPDETGGGERRYSVLTLAERVARPDGVDAVVDVLSYSLTSARAFTRISRELIEAGRSEQALRWAERGLSECGTGRVDHGLAELRQVAVDLYAALGRDHDAADMAAW